MRGLRSWVIALCVSLVLAGCTAQRLVSEGDAFYENGQYEQALDRYSRAVQEDPNLEEAREKLAQTRARLMERGVESARARLSEGDLVGAAHAAADAYAQMPQEGIVLELGGDIAAETVRRSRQLANEGAFGEALDLLEAVYEPLEWKRFDLDAPIRMIKVNWADDLAGKAADAEARGDLGDSLLMYAMAARLLLRPPEVAKRDELRARLESGGLYTVAYEFKGDPRGRKVAQGVVTNAQFAQNVVLVKDKAEVQAVLTVDVSRPTFTTSRSEQTARKDYQDGTRQVENPAYASALDELTRRERDVQERERDDYQRRVEREGDTPSTSTSAEQGVSRTLQRLEYERGQLDTERDSAIRARDRASDTPRTIEEPVMRTLEYTVTTHTRTGRMPMTARVQHTDRRAVIKINDAATMSTSDTTHQAFPFANVSEDTLSLQSDASMTGQMAQVAGNIAVEGVRRSVRSRRDQLLAEAMAIPEASERISKYVEVILLDPTELEEEVLVDIEERRGIIDPVSVLLGAD